MGLDRARKSSTQPGMELNPFTHTPASVLSLRPFPPAHPVHAETNENTNTLWVISLFTIPTVICVHGNGGSWSRKLRHPSDSTSANKHLPAVGALHCFAPRGLNVFDKGKRLGIYFLPICSHGAIFQMVCRGQCVSRLPAWPQSFLSLGFPKASSPTFGCLFCYEGIS